jgi:hypothetical protein
MEQILMLLAFNSTAVASILLLNSRIEVSTAGQVRFRLCGKTAEIETRIEIVTDLDFSVYDRTVYFDVYPLHGASTRESTLTERLRELKELHYEDYISDDEFRERYDFALDESDALDDDWMQVDQLRSTIIKTRKNKAGQRVLMQLVFLVAVVVLIGWAIYGVAT